MENKIKKFSLTYGLIAINLLVWLSINLYAIITKSDVNRLLIDWGAKENLRIMTGEYWRFITSIFLHADLVHLALNCYSLFFLGQMTERLFGRVRFISIYMLAGIMGSIASFVFSTNPSLGASGAIFGLLGALLFFGWANPRFFRATFGNNIIAIVVINLVIGFTITRIDSFAHIGGLVGGFFATGAVWVSGRRSILFNRMILTAFTLLLALVGLFYGFNHKSNTVLLKVSEMAQYDEQQNLTEVERIAEEILSINPENQNIEIEVLWALIRAEALSQKMEESIAHAKQLIEIAPERGHYILGLVYFDFEQYALSRQELLAAKSMNAPYEQIEVLLKELEKILVK